MKDDFLGLFQVNGSYMKLDLCYHLHVILVDKTTDLDTNKFLLPLHQYLPKQEDTNYNSC